MAGLVILQLCMDQKCFVGVSIAAQWVGLQLGTTAPVSDHLVRVLTALCIQSSFLLMHPGCWRGQQIMDRGLGFLVQTLPGDPDGAPHWLIT